jgi:hypothetical protein
MTATAAALAALLASHAEPRPQVDADGSGHHSFDTRT